MRCSMNLISFTVACEALRVPQEIGDDQVIILVGEVDDVLHDQFLAICPEQIGM